MSIGIDRDFTDADRADDLATKNDPDVIATQDDRKKAEEWAKRLKLSFADLQVFCRNGFFYEKIPAEDTAARRGLIEYMKRSEGPPSKWLLISGLYPDCEFNEVERRKRLRALYKALVLLIKRALARQAADAEFGAERSVFWDPIAEVCRDLELAQSKLSAFCKEFSGHSLSQVIDCVRAERVKRVMRVQVREFVRGYRTQCATSVEKSAIGEIDVWAVWKELKASRKWPLFCQNTWAMGFGFANYRRMYRACVAVWKQTPFQMEMGLIAEILGGGEVVEVEGEDSVDESEERVRGISRYSEG